MATAIPETDAAPETPDFYELGQNLAMAGHPSQIAELLLGLQATLLEHPQVSGLLYTLIRAEAADRAADFDALAAGLSTEKGE